MKNVAIAKAYIKQNSYFCFVYLPFVMLVSVIIMLLLRYPSIASKGVVAGIRICMDTLLPSMFPFMFFSTLMLNLKISDNFFDKLSAVSNFLFGLPGISLPIILVSLVGGYPVGAFLVKDAFEKGMITLIQGRRMLLFCVNPGLAFTYSMIGSHLYGSERTGVIVFCVSVITSFIIGVLSRFYEDGEDYCEKRITAKQKRTVSETVISSMNTCVVNTVNVSVWVIMFSCISSLVDVMPFKKSSSDFIKMIIEVTNGVIISKNCYSLLVLCAVVGFCGFCIHLQIMPSLTKLKMRYSHFLCSRILCAALNCVFCFLALQVFPVETDALSLGHLPSQTRLSSSAILCAFLMLMCGLFVLGDGYSAVIKEKNKSANKGNKADLY